MICVKNLSASEFRQVMTALGPFGTRGNELLIVNEGVLQIKGKAHSVLPVFFKPDNERIDVVVEFAFRFFSYYAEFLQNKVDFLQKFKPVFVKAESHEQFDTLIERVQSYKAVHLVLKGDILPLILDYLHGCDIARSMQVSRDFRNVIRDKPYLSQKIRQVQILRESAVIARGVEDKFYGIWPSGKAVTNQLRCVRELVSIAALQLRFDDSTGAHETILKSISAAKEIESAETKDDAWCAIAPIQVQIDPPGAYVSLKRIKDTTWKAIGRGAMTYNFALCQTLAKQSIVDLNGALANARKIENDCLSQRAMCAIAEVQVDRDLNFALKMAASNKYPDLGDRILLKVVAKVAGEDIERAIAFAKTIQDYSFRIDAFILIVEEQAKIDHERAIVIADEFGVKISGKLLVAITAEKAKVDIMEAFSFLKSQQEIDPESFGWHARSLAHISVEQAKIDLNESRETMRSAFALAQKLGTANCMEEALVEITTLQAEVDPEGALVSARMVGCARYICLVKVVASMAKRNIERAFSISSEIEDPTRQAEALALIAAEQAKEDCDEALETAASIDMILWRSRAVASIALAL